MDWKSLTPHSILSDSSVGRDDSSLEAREERRGELLKEEHVLKCDAEGNEEPQDETVPEEWRAWREDEVEENEDLLEGRR